MEEQETGERRKEARNADGGSDCRRAVPNHGTKQCDYRADGFLFSIQWKSISGGKLAKGGADSIETFCRIYVEEAQAEGVRPEVAFVQTMKETGFLQYGGDASIEQFNFAGLGTTGGGVPGNSYPDVRTGVRAQIQHLKAYATADPLAQECVDDRYEYVQKGSAPYVQWLGQKENPQGAGWATAENYGYSIVEMISHLKGKNS